MENNQSILHANQNIEEDRKLIFYILSSTFGLKDKGQTEELTNKIIKTIRAKEWQQKFSSRHFVFIVDEYCRQNIGDIKFLWMCQVIDILYFYEIFKQGTEIAEELHNPKKHGFSTKIEKLSQHYHGKKIYNAKMVKLIRNNVVHTGDIDGIDGAIKQNDITDIDNFKKKFRQDSLRPLAVSANLLFFDMFVRSMGLNDNDLAFNGLPPQNLNFFTNK